MVGTKFKIRITGVTRTEGLEDAERLRKGIQAFVDSFPGTHHVHVGEVRERKRTFVTKRTFRTGGSEQS